MSVTAELEEIFGKMPAAFYRRKQRTPMLLFNRLSGDGAGDWAPKSPTVPLRLLKEHLLLT
jgi:hypothetical protein